MNNIRNDIFQCLCDFSGNAESLIKEISHLIARHGVKTYQVVLHILTNLDIEPDEAKSCWQQILSHRQQISNLLGREASLQTAICDYFSYVNKSLENPQIIEIQLFEELVKESRHDSLTGLLNRRSFDEELLKEISRAKRYNDNFSIVFFDLDNFKVVNDTYGHQAGDEVLKNCATIIKGLTRTEDVVTRYGGDELVLLLPNTDKMKALNFSERLRHEIEKMYVFHGKKFVKVTLSGGVASYPVDASDADSLMRLADKAMYQSKSFGKNNITLFSTKKRRSTRYDYIADLKIRHLGKESMHVFSAMSKNISVDGLLFESGIALNLGASMEITVWINDDKQLLLIGNVAWTRQHTGAQYDIGISFPKTSNSVKEAITEHLLKSEEKYTNLQLFPSIN
jgi:diguanylate cyclase (GGDEF)-like protein